MTLLPMAPLKLEWSVPGLQATAVLEEQGEEEPLPGIWGILLHL